MDVASSRFPRPLLRRVAYLRRNRCSALLAMLCVIIVAAPLLSGTPLAGGFVGIGTMAVLLLAVWALRVRRMTLWAVGVLALFAVQAIAVEQMGEHWLRPVVFGSTALFMAVVTLALLRYVLDWHPITTDKVFGAVSAYVLIAFTFASLFNFIELFDANAFSYAIEKGPYGHLRWSDMMYFSFTVLTSTGFGEITPATGLTRSLIVLEQVLGVMYVAFLIARLANLYSGSGLGKK
ncbi:MAG: potassium channel family protein [Reyranella sp.]|uniref:potassium channel family protein n=1 Tax=Reyranella sp. TaxID=1929291 RepID=UPI003D14A8AC